MPTTFRPYQPDQGLLLPPDLGDWLPEGHLAHHVSDLVDGLDLEAFYARYEGDGRRKSPYEPRMMVKVLIYGYATGVFSSRGMARRLEEDVAFRVLAAGNFPSHRTICEFRRRHLPDFKRLFVGVVRLAAETGVANFGKLSIDGTKVRANASKRKAMSYGRMLEEERRLQAEVDALVERAVDEAEDARFGEGFRGDELPDELSRRQDRLAAIRAAKSRLEARQREADGARGRKPGRKRNPKGGPPYKRDYGVPEDKAQDNFTDPESRIMKTSQEGFQQCYNAQLAVEGRSPAGGRRRGVRQRPGPHGAAGGGGGGGPRGAPGHGTGRRRVLGPRQARGARGGRLRGPGGPPRGCGGRGQAPGQGRHGGEAGDGAGRSTPSASGGPRRPSAGSRRRFRRFSLRGLAKARGEWDLVCLALNVKRMQGLQAA